MRRILLGIIVIMLSVLCIGCKKEVEVEHKGKVEEESKSQKIKENDYLVLKETVYNANEEIIMERNYTYNDSGKILSVDYINFYTEAGKKDLESAGIDSSPYGFTVTYEYDDNGEYPIKGILSGINRDSVGGYEEYKYNEEGLRINLHTYNKNGLLENYYIYSYDDNQNLFYVEQYDSDYRVKVVQNYEYDAQGNEIGSYMKGYYYQEGETKAYKTLKIDYKYEHDKNGRVISKSPQGGKSREEYKYDEHGNVIEIRSFSAGESETELQMSGYTLKEYIHKDQLKQYLASKEMNNQSDYNGQQTMQSDNTNEGNSSWDYTDFAPAPFSKEVFATSQVVDNNWYDNGIFSSYMSMAYPHDIWEYSASLNINMVNNPYDYSGFQIYSHQCEEAQQVYWYLVPISQAPAPEVYAYDINSNTMKLVFSNGNVFE